MSKAYETDKRKVFVVSADYYPDNNAGTARILSFVNHIQNYADVSVLTHNKAKALYDERVVNIPVGNPQSGENFAKRALQEIIFGICVYFRLLFSPKDAIILMSSPPFILCFVFAFLPRWKSIRHVLDVRDIYPDIYRQAELITKDGLGDRILSWIEGRAYKRSDVILTVCRSLSEKIESRSSGTPVEIIMNGYNTEFHTPNGQEKDRGRYLNVITHGNFGKFQDVDLIVRLVEETKNLPIRYNFIGFGSKLKQIPRSSNVHIENSVPHNQIPERLINADVGLSFRTSDPIGRYAVPVKLLEYIGTSLPCIVSPVMPDLAELEEAGAIRQFESHQISEMVSFLEKLLQDPNFYKGMKHSAFEIRDNYSRDAQSQKAIPYIFGYSPQELIR